MAEIREDGYIAIRTAIAENWNKVVLQDESNDDVVEIALTEDNWIHEVSEEQVFAGYGPQGQPIYKTISIEDNQTMEIEFVVKGSDVDSLPTTVVKSAIVDESGEVVREVAVEEFSPFTFETTNDELTITHQINVPTM